MNALIPAAVITVGPVLALAPVVYALRPQGGRRWLSLRPVPAAAILDRLADEVTTGEIPRDVYGGVDRPSQWTVPPGYATADRDLTGSFPVVAVAR